MGSVRVEPRLAGFECSHTSQQLKRLLRAAVAVLLLFLVLHAASNASEQSTNSTRDKVVLSDSEIAEAILRRSRPIRLDPANGLPLVCEVGTEIVNLIGIDEAEETYEIDFYLWVEWPDSRLQFDPDEFGVNEIVIAPQQVWRNDTSDSESSSSLGASAESLWNPYLEIMNLVDAKIAEQALRIESSGKCRLTIRQTGTFKFEPNESTFRKFPFDQQDLTISVESFRWNCKEVRFVTREEDRRIPPSELEHIRLAEWRVTGGHTSTGEMEYSGDQAPFSRASTTITVKRQPAFTCGKSAFHY
jgi:hypothetical protein